MSFVMYSRDVDLFLYNLKTTKQTADTLDQIYMWAPVIDSP